jgi:hypothetical protein
MARQQHTTAAINRGRKLLLSALVVGVLGTTATLGVFGLFGATTQNAGNEISTGTVALSDNDAGSALFSIPNAKPGESWARCIRVSYQGTVPADVHAYYIGGSQSDSLRPYLNVKIEQGTQAASTFPSCTDFAPDAIGTVYDGPATGVTFGNYATGLVTVPAGQTFWQPGDSLVLRVTLALSASTPDTSQGAKGGTATVVWEAREH